MNIQKFGLNVSSILQWIIQQKSRKNDEIWLLIFDI